MSFYIIDTGKEFMGLATTIIEELKSKGDHVVFFYTDHPNLLCIEKVTEDEFLDLFSKEKNTNDKS